MLPGFSSKNNYHHEIGGGGGAKKSKSKKYFNNDDGDNEFNEILLQYNLERMNEEQQQQYDFSHCDAHRDTYPFASSLSKDTDAFFDNNTSSSYDGDDDRDDGDESSNSNDVVEIHLCTYQINTSCCIPFLEYLMTVTDEKDGKKVFEFPKFDYISSKRKSAEKQAEEHILKMLVSPKERADGINGPNGTNDDHHVVKFRGIFKHTLHADSKKSAKPSVCIYILFQKYFKKPKYAPKLSKREQMWWVLTSEIVNFKKVMYMDIRPEITDLFIRNPEIMRLYDCKGRPLETPTVCYFGDEYQKIKYLAFFGLLKAPVKSSFGPFYVATNFLSSMKYACYTHNQQPFEVYSGEKITSGKHGKYKEGGVLRMILFLGKMKVFLKDGEPDNSQISQELAKTDKTVERFLSLRDSNGNWTKEYDTAYKGLHFASINDDVAVNPVEWFFKDYNHSLVISYHNIDTADIPDKFDVDYASYKLK